MAALKQRLTRLEDLIDHLPTASCPSCHGVGHPQRFIIPFIGNTISDWRFGEETLIPDDRLDSAGRCAVCGAPSALPAEIELGLPPELDPLRARLLD